MLNTPGEMLEVLTRLKEENVDAYRRVADQLSTYAHEQIVRSGSCVGFEVVPGSSLTPEEISEIDLTELEDPEVYNRELEEGERQLTESLEMLARLDTFKSIPSTEHLGDTIKNLIQSDFNQCCQKAGLEHLEISTESINSVAAKIYQNFLDIIKKISATLKKIVSWFTKMLKGRKSYFDIIRQKNKESLKYMLKKPDLEIELNLTQLSWFTPPNGDRVNFAESVHGWINIIRELCAYKLNEKNAQAMIQYTFKEDEPDLILKHLEFGLPFKNAKEVSMSQENLVIDYEGPKLSGAYQLLATYPNHTKFNVIEHPEQMLKALSKTRFALYHDHKFVPQVNRKISLNISELSNITDLYSELDRYVIMLSMKLMNLDRVSSQLEKRMILAKHSVSNSTSVEARQYASDNLIVAKFIYNTFKQPIFSVAIEVSKLQTQLSTFLDRVHQELAK